MLRNRAPLLAVAAFVSLIGCGESAPETYSVRGKVLYEGKPLPLGMVMLVPAEGEPASAKIEPDGSYSVEAPPGKLSVGVLAMPPQQGRPDPNVEGGIDTTGFPPVKSLIPAKFNRFDTSGVTIEVKPIDENVIDIVLK